MAVCLTKGVAAGVAERFLSLTMPKELWSAANRPHLFRCILVPLSVLV